MLNSIILMGRLTADPEARTTASDISVTTFTLAVERNFANKQSGERITDFIDVVAWRQTADFVCRYFSKGQLVAVQGSLQTRTYQDRNGSNRKAFEVIADQVYFAEAKRTQSEPREVKSRDDAIGVPMNDSSSHDDFISVPCSDDDLPFEVFYEM